MKRIALIASILALGIVAASAQSARRGLQTGGSIAVTDTFQNVKPADDTRQGCLFQNKGTNTMFVFLGPIASATKNLSFEVTTKLFFSTNQNNLSIMDAINITGTSADLFVINCY